MFNRKAQNGGPAAGLVAIIAFLIVLYILFLPADVRENLINGTDTTDGTTSSSGTSSNVLVFEHPGTLDPEQNTDTTKVLDSFNLYAEKSAKVLQSTQAVHVENAWFKEQAVNVTFSVDDTANTDNYVLAFDVTQSSGRLIVELNGREIFNSGLQSGNAAPIVINKRDVMNENSVIFKVSGVGLAFWRVNEFDLSNVRVIADYTDISKRTYKNFFVISATEKQNFDTTKLNFVPDCLTPSTVGPLSIAINDHSLPYSAVPDCGSLSSIEFDPAYLKQGENVITFSADEGNYFVDRVAIKAELKDSNYPIYYFELAQKDFNRIKNGTSNVTLELKFADKDDKTGEIIVNGHSSRLESENATFAKSVSSFIDVGQNYLQIKPITILNIVDLKVLLRK